MKRFFKIVLTLAVLAFIGYGIAYFVMPVNTVALEEYTHEAAVKCNSAYIVRNETVYYATSAGTVYNTASQGERVANNESIVDIYSGINIDTQLRQLETIDKKAKRLSQKNIGEDNYQIDAASAENEISSRMNEVISLADDDSVEEIHETRTDINGLRNGNIVSISDKLAELDRERIEVEAAVGVKNEVISSRSGIFSSQMDGLEAVLSPDRAEQYTAQYIRSLMPTDLSVANGTSVVVGDPLCKVMDNHEWYVLAIIDKDYTSLCTQNRVVSIKLPNTAAGKAAGTIQYVSEPDENGECIVLVRIPSYIEFAFAYRNVDVDIVLESYSGYKIPSYAVHTGDGINSYYVYAMKGSERFRCECEVVYNDPLGEYAIIRSLEGTENQLSAMERLVVGER